MRDHGRSTKRHATGGRLLATTMLALALAVTGCTLGPDYRRPETALPAAYDPVAPTPAGDETAPIAADWWTMYGDAELSRLVDAALAHNPNIRLAIARIDEARAVLRETNAAFFPELDYSGTGVRARSGVAGGALGGSSTSATGAVSYGKLFRLDGELSYELDLWGRLRRASESASASLLSTTYARDVVRLSLATTTAQAYFTLRSLDAQIKVTENTLQAVGESLDIAQKRLSAGYSSALDYAQAETLRAQTQVNLRDLRRQRALQEHQLGNLTSDLSLRIAAAGLDDLPVPAVPPPGLPSNLLQRRPDVRRDEQTLVAANAEIGVAKAALFPTFGLTGAYGGQSFALSDLLKAPFRFWNIGLGISGPIFAGGKYVARLDEARARGSQQVATYQTTVEGAFREVADALTNVAESNAAETDVQTQVDAARRTLRLSRLRYQSGYSGYLDVLDATRTANTAELTFVQNRAARLNYSVDLIKALGGGWNGTDSVTGSMTGSTTVSPTGAPPSVTSSPVALDRAPSGGPQAH